MTAKTRLCVSLLSLVLAHGARAEGVAQQIVSYGTNYAYCMAVDSHGDIWVTHVYASYIDKIDEDTLTSTPIIEGTKASGALGIAIDSNDNVYYAAGDNLWKRDPEGTQCNPPTNTEPCLRKVVKGTGTGNHGSRDLWPVTVDTSDNVYVGGRYLDGSTDRIAVFKVSPSGTVTTYVGPASIANHTDVAVDASGNVFVSSYLGSNDKVYRFPAAGGSYVTIDSGVDFIDGIEVDSGGNLWIAGRSVLKITPTASNFSTWTSTDLTPESFADTSNTWMELEEDELYVVGVSGQVWGITDDEDPELLLDDSGDPIFDYGLDVIENARGYLYLSTEYLQEPSPPFPPGSEAFESVWRICENADGDMRCDDRDNCREAGNATTGDPLSQLDPDHDGYGSRCDADFDQNGVAGVSDFGTISLCEGQTVGPGVGPTADPTCAESDLDGSGVVDEDDFDLFVSLFAHSAGPSGLDCATSPPTNDSCP
ncbi:MAG TPA: hypothetical protein VII72_12670 [Myxococcota bacterium]